MCGVSSMNENIPLREKIYSLKKALRKKSFAQPLVIILRAIRNLKKQLIKSAKYIAGKPLFILLKLRKRENEIYLLIGSAVGDSVYGLAYIEALRKKYPDKRIIVFGAIKNEAFLRTYPCIDELRLSNIDYVGLMVASHQVEKCFAENIIIPIPNYFKRFKQAEHKATLFNIRRYIYELPDDAPITYHTLPVKSVTAIKDFDSVKDRIVIVNPYDKTSKYYDMDVFKPLCSILHERGYIVYTNILPFQTAISGTHPLNCSLEELYSIACQIKLIVSRRSGALDFLIPSGINMFALDDLGEASAPNKFFEFYPLSEWHSKGRIEEVKYYHRDEDRLVLLPEKFSRFLDELKQEGKLS